METCLWIGQKYACGQKRKLHKKMSQQLKADTLGKRRGQTDILQGVHRLLLEDWFLFIQWMDFSSIRLLSFSQICINFFVFAVYHGKEVQPLNYTLKTTLL